MSKGSIAFICNFFSSFYLGLLFSLLRNDQKIHEEITRENSIEELQFHQKCYDSYIHPKNVSKAQRAMAEESSEASSTLVESADMETSSRRQSARKRDRLGIYIFSSFNK